MAEPIAVVGVGCRFPGGADSPSKLWSLLRKAPEVAKEIPPDRWNRERYYHPDHAHPGTGNVQEAYFLEQDVWSFDAGFFSIPPNEAVAMDPQHRLLMETVYESLEYAGFKMSDLQGSDTAAYVGMMNVDHMLLMAQDAHVIPTYNVTGVANSNASARLSYFFDWHGPCMTIDTACSSSLVAVYEAIQTLRQGRSRLAVAAGTNLILSPSGFITESKLQMLSPQGRSQMWDASADGYARGEGIASLVLKRLSDAVADGDNVQWIIRECGVNQDGRTKGITMPSNVAQAQLIRQVYADAGLDPQSPQGRPQFFEAHGTGTPVGDPLEAEALHSVFFPKESTASGDVLHVGSIKSVLGHTESTAGIAGVLKACLAMTHGEIPPNRHFRQLNPSVAPFYNNLNLVHEVTPWPQVPDGAPRRASVNSFGFGGTNAHCIVETYGDYGIITESSATQTQTVGMIPLLFSGASEKALRSLLQSYQEYFVANPSVDRDRLAYTLACRRSHHPYKAAIASGNMQEMTSVIENLLASNNDFAIRSDSGKSCVLGIFTGQGAQWPQMGTQIIRGSPYARKIIADLDEALQTLPEEDRPSWTIADELNADATNSRVGEAAISQPLCCAVQLLLVDLLRSAEVHLDAVVGHSSGEIAAAHAAGFLSRTDAIRIAYYRGLTSIHAASPTGQPGAMLAVGTSMDDGAEICALEDFRGRAVVAAVNSPTSITISGDADAVERIKNVFEDEDKFARMLRVDKAYHSHHMKPASAPFIQKLQVVGVTVQEPHEQAPVWFSSVKPGLIPDRNVGLDGAYWAENLVSPVLFSQAIAAATASRAPFDAAIEVGPHPALKGPTLDTLEQETGKNPGLYTGLLSRGKHDVAAMAKALGDIWSLLPSAINFESLQRTIYEDDACFKVLNDIPTYQWDHSRPHHTESRVSRLFREQPGGLHDLLGVCESSGTEEEIRWRNLLNPRHLPWLTEHRLQGQVVFPATGYFCVAVEAAMQVAAGRPVQLLEITDIFIQKAIAIDDKASTELIVSLTKIRRGERETTASFACFSTLSRESANLALNATGEVRIIFGDPKADVLAPRPPSNPRLRSIDINRFYDSVSRIGFDYGDAFRVIKSMDRKSGCCSGKIEGPPNNATGTELLFHPGTLDAAVHGFFGAVSAPGDEALWTLYPPSTVKKLSVVPSLCGMAMSSEILFDCTVTNVQAKKFMGDIEVYQSGTGLKSISMEGIGFVPLAAATAENDKHIFAHNVFNLEAPNGKRALGTFCVAPEDKENRLIAERVAFYYLRVLHETITEAERVGLEPHFQALLDWAAHIYGLVERGERPWIGRDCLTLTHEDVQALVNSFDENDPGLTLLVACGENLPASIRKETTILEHMTKMHKLDRFYDLTPEFTEINAMLATMVETISHRFPRMKVCEVGAGTGSSTRAVLEKCSRNFSTYTYTDISSSFFMRAQETFAAYKDLLLFKTFDVTKHPGEQGFEPNTYDLVLAANVLHATPDLEVTMRNVRHLLKPGGYAVILEFVDQGLTLRTGVSMGGLPGWWVGHETGRKWSPGLTIEQWDDVTKRSGFGGVDTVTPIEDPVASPFSAFVCQALDADITTLRAPLKISPGELPSKHSSLHILGGTTPAVAAAIQGIIALLAPHYSQVHHVNTWADLELDNVEQGISVLSLTDLDGLFWPDIDTIRFDKFRQLILSASNVLWVTWGADCDNPDGGQTLGFFRTLRMELPEIQQQVISFDDPLQIDTALLATKLLHLVLASHWESRPTKDTKLWTTEPELFVRKGDVYIPRLLPCVPQNDRYNSFKRTISKEVEPQEADVVLEWQESHEVYVLHEQIAKPIEVAVTRPIRVDNSLLSAINTPFGHLFFSLGTDTTTNECFLSASTTNVSRLPLSDAWSLAVTRGIDSLHLSCVLVYLLGQAAIAAIPVGSTVICHGANQVLASVIERQLAEAKCKVIFTTSDSIKPKQNWFSLHPLTPDRHIRSLIPPETTVYIDFTALLSPMTVLEGSEDTLGRRIAANLPKHCQKVGASTFIQEVSTLKPGDHDDGIRDLLVKAQDFVAAQLNELLEATPLVPISVREIVNNTVTPARLSLVDWFGERTLPVQVEPIYTRTDLFRSDRSYWLIGLAGDLGQSLCEFMITAGARYIILTSRNPEIAKEWIEDQAVKGAQVVYINGDVTKRADLERVHGVIKATMPTLAGVANGALVLRDKGFRNMDLETYHINARPKVDGLTHLNEIFPDNNLDWFIAFSSVAAMSGNYGQLAYSSANVFMKALIRQRHTRGVAGSVIDVASVYGVGFVERQLNSNVSGPAMRVVGMLGLWPMSELDLHQLFAEAIVAGRPGSGLNPELTCGPREATSAEAPMALWYGNPRFSHYVRDHNTAQAQGSTQKEAVPLKEQLLACKDVEEMVSVAKSTLITQIKGGLMITGDVSDTMPLVDLGVDSLVAVEIRKWFARDLGADIAVLKILGGASVEELIEGIIPQLEALRASAEGEAEGAAEEVKSLDSSGSTSGVPSASSDMEGDAAISSQSSASEGEEEQNKTA